MRRWPLYLTSVVVHMALVGHWLARTTPPTPAAEIAITVATPPVQNATESSPTTIHTNTPSTRSNQAKALPAQTAQAAQPTTSSEVGTAQSSHDANAHSNTAAGTSTSSPAHNTNSATAPNQSRNASAAQSYQRRCSTLAKQQALRGGDFIVTLDVNAAGQGRNARINRPSSVELMNRIIKDYAEAVAFKPALDAAGNAIAGKATITIRHADCS
jgi:outer membrane biosynthesis protein TonB